MQLINKHSNKSLWPIKTFIIAQFNIHQTKGNKDYLKPYVKRF